MKVNIRTESYDDKTLMDMLKRVVTAMVYKLDRKGFPMYENMVHIWIKEYNGNLYPKIEFDINRQELQYDLNHDGTVNEAHFKSFENRNGKVVRVDLNKQDAYPELIRLDNIIRYTED